jgi:hypothetical protein
MQTPLFAEIATKHTASTFTRLYASKTRSRSRCSCQPVTMPIRESIWRTTQGLSGQRRVPQLQRRSDVWLLNITRYVPRHKHQHTTPLSLPYLQLAVIIHAVRPLHPQMDLGPLQAHPPTTMHIDLCVHITALASISRCIAGEMGQDMLPSSRSKPKPSEQWNRLPERHVLNRSRGR